MYIAIKASTMELANPPSTSTFHVPKAKVASPACRRASMYAMAVMARAMACVLMCQPSASSAMELKSQPAAISTTIIVAVSPTTRQLFSSPAWFPEWKLWPCTQGVRSRSFKRPLRDPPRLDFPRRPF